MAQLDLRPLSLGEMLDRTFSLYRGHFGLFLGISAIPQILILGVNLLKVFLTGAGPGVAGATPAAAQLGVAGAMVAFVLMIVGAIAYVVSYLYAQGGTVFAVSDLYLGRPTTIGGSLRRMRGHAANLFGVSLLSGLAAGAAAILLIIPGIYVACRLITCIPAAVLEDLGASASLSRSFELTKGSAGRSFVIYLLYFVILLAAMALFMYPFAFAAWFYSVRDPGLAPLWLALTQIGNAIAAVLVTPILTIATAVFYYDLRVRKEGFDLQLLMNPDMSAGPAPAPSLTS